MENMEYAYYRNIVAILIVILSEGRANGSVNA
jgi:hypothetical protein